MNHGWVLFPRVGWTALCRGCGHDLLTDHEFAFWAQPEGVEESLADEDYCPKCNWPLTERAKEAIAERDE